MINYKAVIVCGGEFLEIRCENSWIQMLRDN